MSTPKTPLYKTRLHRSLFTQMQSLEKRPMQSLIDKKHCIWDVLILYS